MSLRVSLLTLVLCTIAVTSLGGTPPMIEFQVGQKKVEGKVIAQTSDTWCVMGQDGRLNFYKNSEVTQARQVSPQFHGWNSSIMKDQLRREFSRPYDVASARHYLVVAKGDAQARRYADILESFFSTFQMYFSLRGFKVPEPEFPMVAIVFPSQEAFGKYAQQERQRISNLVRGYYMPTSNRIAFFESAGDPVSTTVPNASFPSGGDAVENPFARHAADFGNRDGLTTFGHPLPWGSVEGSLKDTLIHEATHQAAFNTGLHSRIGQSPAWMVEGLATVFEAAGVRNSRADSGVKSRINPERLVWFGDFAKSRRKPQSLETFLSNDDLFATKPLDAYSQAWALTFYLFETRPRNYAEYLRSVASRNPLELYTPEARVADFQRAISKEIKLFEAEFLRFMAEIR
jgi:Protein of unknown function (DUF1570)